MNTLKLTCNAEILTFSIAENTIENTGRKYNTVKIESSDRVCFFRAVYPYNSATIYDVILQNLKDAAESKLLNITRKDQELVDHVSEKIAYLESLVIDPTVAKFLKQEISI